jgi:hypothetical protein
MADDAIVIAAGVPPAWLDGGDAVVVDGLATYWGPLGFTLRRSDPATLTLALRGDLTIPAGGLVLRPPLDGPLGAVEVDGVPASGFAPDEVVVRHCPATVVMRYREA